MTNPLALIIEDHKDLAEIFTRALQHAEFDTETIKDGTVALARLAAVVPVRGGIRLASTQYLRWRNPESNSDR